MTSIASRLISLCVSCSCVLKSSYKTLRESIVLCVVWCVYFYYKWKRVLRTTFIIEFTLEKERSWMFVYYHVEQSHAHKHAILHLPKVRCSRVRVHLCRYFLKEKMAASVCVRESSCLCEYVVFVCARLCVCCVKP